MTNSNGKASTDDERPIEYTFDVVKRFARKCLVRACAHHREFMCLAWINRVAACLVCVSDIVTPAPVPLFAIGMNIC